MWPQMQHFLNAGSKHFSFNVSVSHLLLYLFINYALVLLFFLLSPHLFYLFRYAFYAPCELRVLCLLFIFLCRTLVHCGCFKVLYT